MIEAEKQRLFDYLARLTHGLGKAVGKNCEVVLHDFSDPEKTIIAIENGHITGRKVGDTMDVLGFQLLRHPPKEDLINYRTEAKGGKVLRSSSILLRDETGKVFGSICVNYDITALIRTQEWLQDTVTPCEMDVKEEFEHSVEDVLNRLIQDAIRSTGKPVTELDREDNIAVISYLEAKGAFLIRYSVDRVAELLKVSKYTIYNYLDEVKARQTDASELAPKAVMMKG